jgi:hypothetical protein
MNSENKFWINLWSIVGTVMISLAMIIAVWNHYDNERRLNAWLACVEIGGQPINEAVIGSTISTFTCIRK